MELKDYWQTIRHRWKVIVLTLGLTVAVAGLLTAQATPEYASSTKIFISTSPSDTSQAYTGNLFATQRVSSYADLVKSRQLAERVADDLGGTMTPEALQEDVVASVVPETVSLKITATDPDPSLARDIAQAYAEALSTLVAGPRDPGREAGARSSRPRSSTTPRSRPRRSARSRSATSAWRSCSGCCSASASP